MHFSMTIQVSTKTTQRNSLNSRAVYMRLLLDENLPRSLKSLLIPHEVKTVQELGWGSISNGDLVAKADGMFDVLLTADKNLRYQQNLTGRQIAIDELPTNRKAVLMSMARELHAALLEMQGHAGKSYVEIPWPIDQR
jgi:hypothetical protein